MSDTAFSTFHRYGTDAERLAFVPAPAVSTGYQPLYEWYATDTGITWLYDSSWHQIGAAGAAAPANATYITQTANAGLSAEQALSTLATGLMRVATATGVITSLTDSAGLAANISDETGSGALVFATSPTLVTPALGTPSALVLTNATGLVAGGFDASLGVIRRASVTLTNANVLALPTTPVQLVAAPGAGFYLAIWKICLKANFSTAAYTNVNATFGAMYGQIGTAGNYSQQVVNDSATTPAISALTNFMGNADRVTHLGPYLESITVAADAGYVLTRYNVGGIAIADEENKALFLQADNNGSGNFTGGNAANDLKVVAYYTIEAIP